MATSSTPASSCCARKRLPQIWQRLRPGNRRARGCRGAGARRSTTNRWARARGTSCCAKTANGAGP
eukprot:2561615-Lingulodinium_polyedra.AAC.1